MMKMYNRLEAIVKRYIGKPLAIAGLVGIVFSTTPRTYGNDVAIDSIGNFTVTMECCMGSNLGVYAQRFNKGGERVGEEFLVSENGMRPHIATKDDGEFIITWNSYGSDGTAYRVLVQRHNKDGTKIGDEIQVSDGFSSYPNITMNNDKFIVAWESQGEIFAKGYDTDGNELWEKIHVNTYMSDEQNYPSIAMNKNGDFVIAWYSYPDDIRAQIFDRDRNRVVEEFLVSENGGYEFWHPSVAMNNSGDFIFAWSAPDSPNSDYGIFAQQYNNNGNEIGGKFRVNANIEGLQYWENIAMNKNGGEFVITWFDLDRQVNFAQRYDREKNRIGEEFQVLGSDIDMNDSGYFVVGNKIHHFSDVFFRRGDANRDKEFDISDPISTLFHLFSDLELKCLDAADSNDDGQLDVSDPIYSLYHLFLGKEAPPFPYPWPGKDYTQDGLDCKEY